jgi:hypothetical protein
VSKASRERQRLRNARTTPQPISHQTISQYRVTERGWLLFATKLTRSFEPKYGRQLGYLDDWIIAIQDEYLAMNMPCDHETAENIAISIMKVNRKAGQPGGMLAIGFTAEEIAGMDDK